MNGFRLLLVSAIAAIFIGCEETPNTSNQDTINESGFFAVYDPSAGKLPFPTNILFTGTDPTLLTLNIPPSTGDSAGTTAVKAALNDLDGFSTTAPITVDFTGPIDSTTLIGQDTVRVFEVSLAGFASYVDGVSITELVVNTDYALSVSTVDSADGTEKGANKLVISPLKPLKPKTSYMVVVTNGVKSTAGENAASSFIYALTKGGDPLYSGGASQFAALTDAQALGLEPLRGLNNTSEAVGLSTVTGLAASDIVVSFSFTTQSTSDVLTALQMQIELDAVPVSSINSTAVATSPQDGVMGFIGSDIYIGEITLPYYLNVPANDNDSSLLTGSWRGTTDTPLTGSNPTIDPSTSTAVTVPLLISIPNGAEPGTGWPVVIYQHGITTSRGTMLGIADALANVGYAVVAIDMPLHGLLGTEDLIGGFKAATDAYSAAIHGGTALVQERTFDIDIFDTTKSTTDADGDGTIDDSGAHFINLSSLLTSRDNVRQAVADLMSLKRALGGMDYNGATAGGVFDLTKVHFVGHSLGAVVGGVFLAVDNGSTTPVESSVLGMPGGSIAKVLDGSARFGPVISAGLAANGVNKGTAEYEGFLASAQMVLDSGDPINYATDTVAGRDVLLFEVVGDGVDKLSDQVIPNNVLTVANTVAAPLAGTDPLVSLMSLKQLDTSTMYVANTDTVVKFSGGHHGSLLTTALADETPNLDSTTDEFKAYAEMQSEMAAFIFSNGGVLAPADADIVSTVPMP